MHGAIARDLWFAREWYSKTIAMSNDIAPCVGADMDNSCENGGDYSPAPQPDGALRVHIDSPDRDPIGADAIIGGIQEN
jgi:hypothetical protein